MQHITEDIDKAKAVEAAGLLHQVHSFKFLACLIIFQRIMSITKSLSDQLQSRTADSVYVAGLVSSTTHTLRDFRSDSVWDHTYKYICDVASLNGIEKGTVDGRRRKQPRRLEDSITFETTGRHDSLSCGQSIKLNIYFPVLDHCLSEFDRRFSTSNLDLMKSLDGCSPLSSKFLDSALLSSLALKYKLNHELPPK